MSAHGDRGVVNEDVPLTVSVVWRAAAGGWSDIGTLMKCYQQADDFTLLEVMSYSKKISGEARAG
jgi:hypothetical protein